ncbi:PPP2R1A-PPP2R2A-interacting phosphatase regulator 1 isoform X2 [Phlebotomus papatasi]|uniref:PPP2R1A-PPP2R2A-interacting phosphatase regulator 1 isoform X2 n=1 Tax=Phlebotomus papatasi TaxID=29031 RepID=UPI0024838233|nr:PPP2R1A-PPP2R2A-interacting phosphatase regulator 1 isoform X2 [Phlebotomus papatasi]XP_055709059.1 PPP2R1A-PPP2R2A-interacting phosphatase regulator 1 isoform X2 [Phlebotomus papatasi]
MDGGDSSLKRCSSAPLINNITAGIQTMTSSQATSTSSRDISPSPAINIFARTRRYSASYSPLAGSTMSPGPRLTPRVSQLRQEECIDVNSREVNHEREVHCAMQMSQSCEDLRIVTEGWSFKSRDNDDLTNPLHVNLPSGGPLSCSSPSPTSRSGGLRYQVMSPSPTRKTFATRRSMSPNAMRPSTLCPVKRKFDLDDNSSTCSPPPYKKMFLESRGSSPICQTPSPICPSPDSGTYEGRITPKFFVSKLCTTSSVSSPSSAAHSPATNSNSGASVASASSGVTVDETMTLIADHEVKDYDPTATKQDITDEECASITGMSANLDRVAERLEVLKDERIPIPPSSPAI